MALFLSKLRVVSTPPSYLRLPVSLYTTHVEKTETIVHKKRPAKELVVNTKYDRCSDPMYRHLVYSTELDVFLTAKRGKVWLERMYARNMAAQRELRDRQAAAGTAPVPIALQYLYGGSTMVQGERTAAASPLEEVLEAETEPTTDRVPVFPYGIHHDIHTRTTGDSEAGDTDTGDDLGQQAGESDTADLRQLTRGRRIGGRRGSRKEHLVDKTADTSLSSPEYASIKADFESEEIRQVFSEDHLFKYGTPNPEMADTEVPCGGCGALLQARAENIPGYIPHQLLERREPEQLRKMLCQRCYLIKEYDIALKVSVSPEDYPKTIQHLKDKDALIILVVDLLDFPGSVVPDILDLLGKKKKIILVGNKVDLLLPDHSNYIKRITNIIKEEFINKCFKDSRNQIFPHVVSAMCVSAKTGFNVEQLIEKIFNYWKWNNSTLPGDIYIVGCTNVGKSSLFNMLLESDLCKVRALDLVQKAITSPVPGTTLNLLKFPVTRPEPHFMSDRSARLRRANLEFRAREFERLEALQTEKRPELAVPSSSTITHTLGNIFKDRQPSSGYMTDTDTNEVDGSRLPDRLNPDSPLFSEGKWCYDSPGTVSQDQIINLLTTEEVTRTLATSPLVPRTLLLRKGHSLLIGGLARLDFTKGDELPPVRVTVFCARSLPINIVETEGVEEFLHNNQLTQLTMVPQGGPLRQDKFPGLLGTNVTITGINEKMGTRDIVLSSAGWVMVSPRKDATVHFIAYTPGGRGVYVRQPFLPFSVNQRGRRILGSPAYRNDRLFLDSINTTFR